MCVSFKYLLGDLRTLIFAALKIHRWSQLLNIYVAMKVMEPFLYFSLDGMTFQSCLTRLKLTISLGIRAGFLSFRCMVPCLLSINGKYLTVLHQVRGKHLHLFWFKLSFSLRIKFIFLCPCPSCLLWGYSPRLFRINYYYCNFFETIVVVSEYRHIKLEFHVCHLRVFPCCFCAG